MTEKNLKRTITINPLFKAVVIICAVMWLLSLIAMLAVVWFPGQDAEVSRGVVATCERLMWVITGAFVGLLGGRAAVPDATRS